MTFIPKFAVAADLHLRIRTWADYPELCGDAFYSFSQIIDQVNHFNIPLLLLGDIFDDPYPDATTVQFFATECRRAKQSIGVIDGNHDFCDEALGDFRGAWGAVGGYHFNRRVLEIGPYRIYGLDYLPRRELQEALSQVPTAIVATHQAWKDFYSRGNYQGEFSWLPPHVTTLLTGDLHKAVIEQRGGVTVVSPGSTCLQKIDEAPHKSFVIAGEEVGAPGLSFRPQPLRTRAVFVVDATTDDGFERFRQSVEKGEFAGDPQLPPQLQRPILRVAYSRGDRARYEKLVSLCQWAHLFLSPKGDAGPQEVVITTRDTGEGLLSTVETMLGGRTDTYRGIERLLTTPGKSPAAILDDMEKEFMMESRDATGHAG